MRKEVEMSYELLPLFCKKSSWQRCFDNLFSPMPWHHISCFVKLVPACLKREIVILFFKKQIIEHIIYNFSFREHIIYKTCSKAWWQHTVDDYAYDHPRVMLKSQTDGISWWYHFCESLWLVNSFHVYVNI